MRPPVDSRGPSSGRFGAGISTATETGDRPHGMATRSPSLSSGSLRTPTSSRAWPTTTRRSRRSHSLDAEDAPLGRVRDGCARPLRGRSRDDPLASQPAKRGAVALETCSARNSGLSLGRWRAREAREAGPGARSFRVPNDDPRSSAGRPEIRPGWRGGSPRVRRTSPTSRPADQRAATVELRSWTRSP